MTLDTVDAAGNTPETDQPYAELGLKPDGGHDRSGRSRVAGPTSSELAMYLVVERTPPYKSSMVHLRQFGEKALAVGRVAGRHRRERRSGGHRRRVAVTFKVESHNHPSYVEPYQCSHRRRGHCARHHLDRC